MTPEVVEWLNTKGSEDNWFLHVNLWDVHVPYRTPKAFEKTFSEEEPPDMWQTAGMLDKNASKAGLRSAKDAIVINQGRQYPHQNPSQIESLDDVQLLLNSYDHSLRYTDEQVGLLLECLEQQGILEETAVIISADHGECLGELNAWGGHCLANEATSHVPLIIRWPGWTDKQAGQCDENLHYNIDLATAVVEAVRGEIPDCWDAQNLMKNKREYLVLSQLAQACQRSLIFYHDNEKYIYIRSSCKSLGVKL